MVLNHPLPLCANTFVLLRDSAHRVMSIYNARSEAMNVKSPVYTAIVYARGSCQMSFFISDGPPDGRSLIHQRTTERTKKQSCHPCHSFCFSMEYASDGRCDPNSYEVRYRKRPRIPRWGMCVKCGSEKIFGFLSEQGKGKEGGRRETLISVSKSYVRCSDKSLSDRERGKKMCKECSYWPFSAQPSFSPPFSICYRVK